MSPTDNPIDIDDLIRRDGETWRAGFTPPPLDDLLPATPDVRDGGGSAARRRLAVLAVAATVAAGAVAITAWSQHGPRDGAAPAAGPSMITSAVSSVPARSAAPDAVHHEVSQTANFTGGVAVRISLTADRIGSLSFGSDDAPVVNYLPDPVRPRAGVDQTVTVSLAPGRYRVVYKPVAERYLSGPAAARVVTPFPIGAAAAAKGAHPCAPATIRVADDGPAQFDLTC